MSQRETISPPNTFELDIPITALTSKPDSTIPHSATPSVQTTVAHKSSFYFPPNELSARSLDDLFWRRIIIHDELKAADTVQDARQLLDERDSALAYASQCGLHLLQLLRAMENDYIKQAETTQATLTESANLLSEKDAALRCLEQRIENQIQLLYSR